MSELYGSRAEDGDDSGPADASRETNEADQHRGTPDSQDTPSREEDEEPLSRGEYADMMHDEASAEGDDSYHSDGHDDQYAAGDTAALEASDRVELAEPRTRQEVAEEAADDSTQAEADHHDNQAADSDLDARIAEQDKLPEPRTRQEVSEQDRPGADPLTDVASQEGGTAEQADAEMRLTEAAQHLEPEHQPEEQDDHQASDREPHHEQHPLLSIVQATPDDRTLGDTNPTGIGRKPTGEDLAEMESDKLSRADRFRRNVYDRVDDIQDVAEKTAGVVEGFLGEHRPTGQDVVYTAQPTIEAPQLSPVDAGNVATAGLALGLLTDRAIRWVMRRLNRSKG